MAEDDSEGESDTGVTGERQLAQQAASTAASSGPGLSAAAEKKLEEATDVFVETEGKAEALRMIATGREAQEKLAQRLHDAKQKRLDNGDKLKRRKTGFGAAKRSYEAIIWLQHEQIACARARCEAAEAERDAAKAELRLEEIANELYARA
jgi:ribose 1,5-bisphosphokinase PhnN